MNLHLLYPPDEESFKTCGLPGSFTQAMASKPVCFVEIQLMLYDYLKVKKVQHKYYEVTRSGDKYFNVIESPIFNKPVSRHDKEVSRLTEENKELKDEITKLKERLAALEGNVQD